MIKIGNGRLYVKGEATDVFEVKTKDVSDEMFLKIVLIPNENTRENGVEEESLLVDLLNETIGDVLKENGYAVIKESDIEHVQNKDW